MNTLNVLMFKLALLALIAMALCACGGGGGGASGPPAANPPPASPPPEDPPPDDPPPGEDPIACAPETDAQFPAFVYFVPGQTPDTREYLLASSDGCRTESMLTGVDGGFNAPTGVYADGTGFIAWMNLGPPSVEIMRFSAAGAAGAETVSKQDRETVLQVTGQYDEEFFASVDAWRDTEDELLVLYRLQASNDNSVHRRSLLLLDLGTGAATELWAMTLEAQLACLQQAQAAGANPYTADACVMPRAPVSWTADGQRVYFGHRIGDQAGFQDHNGTSRIERRDTQAGCRGSLPDLGNGWCGPEIVHADPLADEPPVGGRVRPADSDGVPELLAGNHWDTSVGGQKIVVLDADFCAAIYDDPAQIDPLLAAGHAWRTCLYAGTPLQDYVAGAGPDWTLDWQLLYYSALGSSSSSIRVFNPFGMPTDGDREVIEPGIAVKTLR